MKITLMSLVALWPICVYSYYLDTVYVVDTLSSEIPLTKSTVSLTTPTQSEDLSLFLSRTAGVTTRLQGGAGSFQSISIRGIGGNRVSVFVDGIPQNSARGETYDLSRLSTLPLSEVDIYKGVVPAFYGGSALGGVVSVKTADSDKSGATLSIGSFGEKSGRAFLSLDDSSKALSTSIYYRVADNNYSYLDRGRTVYDPSNTRVEKLKNNSLNESAFYINGGMDLFSGRAKASVSWRDKSLGVPGKAGAINPTSHWDEDDLYLLLSYERVASRGTPQSFNISLINYSGTLFWTELDNMPPIWGVPKSGEKAFAGSEGVKISAIGEYNFAIWDLSTLFLRHIIEFETVDPETNLKAAGIGEWETAQLTTGSSFDLLRERDRLSLFMGGSLLATSSSINNKQQGWGAEKEYDDGLSWQKGGHCGAMLALFAGLSLKGSLSYYERSASLQERFGFKGGVLPTVNLTNEVGKKAELSLSYVGDNLSQEITLFGLLQEDLITTWSSGFLSRYINIGEVKNRGLEYSLRWKINSFLSLEEELVWQKSRNLERRYSGNALPDQAQIDKYTALVIGEYRGFTLIPEWIYRGELYRDRANLMKLPARHEFNLRTLWREERFSCELALLDINSGSVGGAASENPYYGVFYPGRRFKLTVSVDF